MFVAKWHLEDQQSLALNIACDTLGCFMTTLWRSEHSLARKCLKLRTWSVRNCHKVLYSTLWHFMKRTQRKLLGRPDRFGCTGAKVLMIRARLRVCDMSTSYHIDCNSISESLQGSTIVPSSYHRHGGVVLACTKSCLSLSFSLQKRELQGAQNYLPPPPESKIELLMPKSTVDNQILENTGSSYLP